MSDNMHGKTKNLKYRSIRLQFFPNYVLAQRQCFFSLTAVVRPWNCVMAVFNKFAQKRWFVQNSLNFSSILQLVQRPSIRSVHNKMQHVFN